MPRYLDYDAEDLQESSKTILGSDFIKSEFSYFSMFLIAQRADEIL